jgi:LCP family protein required for cell wall assembly
VEAALPKGPLNILVLGSDRRDVIESDLRNKRQYKGGGGQRADTIVLLHLDPVTNQAVIVSFPRDLRVSIPGHGQQKINAAYALGGANLMIKTISKFSGLAINHYVEVNFQSFRGIVDAVGGVSIYIDRPLVDKRSGLNLPRAGCYTMDGDTALSYVRARYVYANADLGRIQAQQQFMRALMKKVKSLGFILNPAKVKALSNEVGRGMRYDSGVNFGLARAVASRLAGFDAKRVDFRVVPAHGATIGGISYLIPSQVADNAIFRAIENGTPLPNYGKTKVSVPVTSDVTVKLLNATGVPGFAAGQRERLSKLGYRVSEIGTTGVVSSTTIVFDPKAQLKADLIKAQYPYADLSPARKPIATDVMVVLGRETLSPPSASAAPKPKKSKTPAQLCE